MSDQIKNRVVGTIVIFALAIIFLPDVLDGKKHQLRDDFKTIPVKPQYQTPNTSSIVVNKPEQITTTKTAAISTKKTTQNTTDSQSTVTASKPVLNQAKIDEPVVKVVAPKQTKQAWVITVGSFKDPKNVASLLIKLRKNGFTAFSVPNKPRPGQTSRVFVGPAFDKAKLVKLQPKLKSLINESGFISSYNPIEK